ncbi:MAG TPA: YgaP-like transmembrane domain [Sphingobacteriaceae bacterium]
MNGNKKSQIRETLRMPLPVNDQTNVNQVERILSITGGSYLFYKSLTNIIKHPYIAIQEAAVGGYLVYRGLTGHCAIYSSLGKDTTDVKPITITERFMVNRPREEVYDFWRKLENLPRFMKHLSSVKQRNERNSVWEANTPGHFMKIVWKAQITREEDGSYLGWQSIDDSMIDNLGKVEFKDDPSGDGTELNIELSYFPPAGHIGRGIASLFTGWFEKMVRADITNFKHYVEGEEYQNYTSSSKQNV